MEKTAQIELTGRELSLLQMALWEMMIAIHSTESEEFMQSLLAINKKLVEGHDKTEE